MKRKMRREILEQLTIDELKSVVVQLEPSYDEAASLYKYGSFWGGMGSPRWEWKEAFSSATRQELMGIYNSINYFYRN